MPLRETLALRGWLLAALLLGGACSSSETKKKPSAEAHSAIDAGAKAPQPSKSSRFVAAPPLRYKVDGKHVEVASMGAEFDLLDVRELPPVADWKTIIVRNVNGREFTGTRPMLLTGIRTMRVVTLASGAWEFRVMEEVPSVGDAGPKEPRIRHKMTDAKSIIIETKDYEPPAAPRPASELKFLSGDSERILDRAAMDAITRSPEPGQREARDTWTLAALLGAAKLGPKSGLRLTDQTGKTLEVSSEELVAKGSVHIIKRNRRGQFNYRRWSLGPPASRVLTIRGIVSIEAL